MKRVLILDDDARAAGRLASQLHTLGFDTAVATDPVAAVEQLQSGGVGVLVAGPHIAGRPGIDMIRLARQVSPGTRSLLMGSEQATAREYKLALEHGAVDVLAWPYTGRDLAHAVRKAQECEQGFHGSIHGLGLPDLLRVLHQGRRSLVVRIGQHCHICLHEGEIVHAVAPPLFGREALDRLLAARSGSLSTVPLEPCPRTIDVPFAELLPVDPPELVSAPLPPSLSPRRSARGRRLLTVFAVATLCGLALCAALLFVLAPRAPRPAAGPTAPGPGRVPLPVSEPLPEEPVKLELELEPPRAAPTPTPRAARHAPRRRRTVRPARPDAGQTGRPAPPASTPVRPPLRPRVGTVPERRRPSVGILD